MARTSMPCSARAHLQSQQSCRKSLGFACGRIGGVRQCTSKASPGLLGGLGAAAPDSTRPSQTTIGPTHSSARGPAPLLLQVVLERELRLPGLQTRKGAKHAPHGQQGYLGANPGRGSNGAAPVAIKAAGKRRLIGQRQLVVEDGGHFGQEAIRALQNCLRARVKRRY